MKARRLFLTVYAIIVIGCGIGAGEMLTELHGEYVHLQQIETSNRERLAAARVRLAEQQRVLERLRTDHAYVEKVIRLQLDYAKPGEVVFRFPKE